MDEILELREDLKHPKSTHEIDKKILDIEEEIKYSEKHLKKLNQYYEELKYKEELGEITQDEIEK